MIRILGKKFLMATTLWIKHRNTGLESKSNSIMFGSLFAWWSVYCCCLFVCRLLVCLFDCLLCFVFIVCVLCVLLFLCMCLFVWLIVYLCTLVCSPARSFDCLVWFVWLFGCVYCLFVCVCYLLAVCLIVWFVCLFV